MRLTLLIFALLLTAVLVLVAMPLSPFDQPGDKPNEATAVLMLVPMALRWIALAVVILLTRFGRGSGGAWRRSLALLVHAGLGLGVLWTWDRWLSVVVEKTIAEQWTLVGVYYGVPALVIVVLMFLPRR